MKISAIVLALAAAVWVAGCKPSAPGGSTPGKPAGPVVEDQEFALGREWVQTMLEEDRKAMVRMRDQLDSVRREVERLDAAGNSNSPEAEAARARLSELLDEQDRLLRKFRENAAEMRKVMGEEPPQS